MSKFDKLVSIWEGGHDDLRRRQQEDYNRLHQEDCFGASTVSSCIRKAYLSRIKQTETNPVDESTKGRFEVGLNFEALELDALLAGLIHADASGYIEHQAQAKHGDYKATTDALWKVEGDPDYPIEIKSLAPLALYKRKKDTGLGFFTPYHEHELQLSLYIYLRHLSQDDCSVDGMLYYSVLDGRTKMPFQVNYMQFVPELQARMDLLNDCWRSGQLPPRLTREDVYPCSLCSYRDFCWKP